MHSSSWATGANSRLSCASVGLIAELGSLGDSRDGVLLRHPRACSDFSNSSSLFRRARALRCAKLYLRGRGASRRRRPCFALQPRRLASRIHRCCDRPRRAAHRAQRFDTSKRRGHGPRLSGASAQSARLGSRACHRPRRRATRLGRWKERREFPSRGPCQALRRVCSESLLASGEASHHSRPKLHHREKRASLQSAREVCLLRVRD